MVVHSAMGSLGIARTGGIIGDRNSSHKSPVGFCSVNRAELLALRMGFHEALRLNLHVFSSRVIQSLSFVGPQKAASQLGDC